jgi:hypothetical protein
MKDNGKVEIKMKKALVHDLFKDFGGVRFNRGVISTITNVVQHP